MVDESEPRVPKQMPDVRHAARVEIVHAHHLITISYKAVAEVGADETGATCNQDGI